MTKKKNIASKLVLVLFVLTLISCCLLGSTFARYVSGGTGSASIGIAKWDVSGLSDSMDISVTKISPKKEAATETNKTTPRQNIAVAATALATITNHSDVDADVTVTVSGYQATLVTNAEFSETGWETDKKPSQAEFMDTVQLQFGTSADAQTQPTTWSTVNNTTSFSVYNNPLAAKTENATASICIWYRVVWESQDDNKKVDDADAFDTWIGQNVTSISANLSFSAVQGSELPTTQGN